LILLVAGMACQKQTAPRKPPAKPAEKTKPTTPLPQKILPAAPFVPGSWTLVVLPDTQFYTRDNPKIFTAQTQWIAENKNKFNIQLVLHVGDIVQDNTELQWLRARKSMQLLDGKVPYVMVTGNHDYDNVLKGQLRQSTGFGKYFKQPVNSAQVFEIANRKWLVLGLEFGPTDATVSWAQQQLATLDHDHAILLTHAYMYFDDTRLDWAGKGLSQRWNPHSYGFVSAAGTANDGEQLWQKLVKDQRTMRFVLSGHVKGDGLAHLASRGSHRQRVHQFAVNYQTLENGGQGFLRLMEFLPNQKGVQIKTYSPWKKAFKTDAQNQYLIEVQPQ